MANPWDNDPIYKPLAKAPAAAANPWDNDPVVSAESIKPAGSGSKVIDAGNAVATGYLKGLTRLAALPVDTIANIRDLGKAAIGAPYIALTGKAPPEWLQVDDRANTAGSGDYLIKKASGTKLGNALLQPQNPEYQGGYAETVGGALTGVVSPTSARQAINQAVNSVAGAVAGKAAYDKTGNTALAIAAGMSPTAVQSIAIDGTKYLVRGGEQGRRAMEQRIADLKAAGVENPTLGLASGNKLIGGTENLLQSTPGAVGIMQRNRDAALDGIEAKTLAAADLASTNRGALESGRSIQRGAQAFKDGVKDKQTELYNRLDQHIPGQAPVNVGNTLTTLADLNADIPGAPALSRQFKNARIAAIEEAIKSDTAGAPATVMVYQPQPVGAGGLMNPPVAQSPILVNVPQGPPRNTLPFEAVKKTRTLVGNEIADNSMMSDVPRSKWNPLYGALSEDMQGAASAAGPAAEGALNRANNYTRASIDRLERIAPVVDRPAPEQSFTALQSTLKENASIFQAVKKSLPEGARGDFAGTVIERLGRAKPGQQNALGDRWSPESFLTNWNNMKPQARAELFSGFKNAAQVEADVNAIANATAMMRENSKMWANPSGTGANSFARATLGAIGVGGGAALMGLGSPVVPLAAAGTLAGSNLLARALTSQKIVNSLASRSYVDPHMQAAQVNALIGSGLLNKRAD